MVLKIPDYTLYYRNIVSYNNAGTRTESSCGKIRSFWAIFSFFGHIGSFRRFTVFSVDLMNTLELNVQLLTEVLMETDLK